MLPQAPADANLAALVALATTGGPQPPLDDPAVEILAREAVRLLAPSTTPEAIHALGRIAADTALPGPRRADAVVGLGGYALFIGIVNLIVRKK